MDQISKALPYIYVPSLPIYHPSISYHPYCPRDKHILIHSTLSSPLLCSYNQIGKPQKMEPLPCILIRVAGPLEQTGLQDVEVTADIVEVGTGKKKKN